MPKSIKSAKSNFASKNGRRFDVPMDEPDVVCGFHGHRNLLDDVDSTAGGQRTTSKDCLEVTALDQTHVDE